jgi:aminopeptidase N
MNRLNKKWFLLLVCSLLFHRVFPQLIDVFNRPLRSERSRDFDVLHYKIKLNFDEDKKIFWGETTITLTPFKEEFKQLALDAETFTVNSVQDHDSKMLRFEQPANKLVIFLPRPHGIGDKLSIKIFYQAKNIKADPQKFGMSKGYALGLTFVEKSPANPRLIQALSFPTGARHWFPCYDHPNDKATQEIIATVREEYKVLSNGRLIKVLTNKMEKTKTYHWFQKQPHPTYLSTLIAGPYVIIEDSLGPLKINYWVYEKDKKNALRSFYKTPEIIKFFIKEFGYDYPWAKYDQITVPGIGGGAECTSATLIGQGTIHDEKADKDFPSHSLVAHEAAHQWWGDLVTLRDWGHTWINESFGTYFDYIFTKYDLGDDEGAINLLNKKNAYLKEAHNRYMRPIVFHRWNYPNENFDRHTYPKGAAVIHMMRWILGEKPFKKTISHFLRKHAFGSADTHDFLTAIKEGTGQNMDWFFQQWLYKPGHPVFDIRHQWQAPNKNLQISVSQTQDTSGRIPIFKTPVIFKIVTSEGVKYEKVWIKNQQETFNFSCQQKPLLVRFDEGNYLLKEWTFQKELDELIYQLKFDDVIGRCWAAMELGKFGKNPEAIEALFTCAQKDNFWAVRSTAVSSIGDLKDKKYIGFLKRMAQDQHSKVRSSAIKGLGGFKQNNLVKFFEIRFQKENSYLAQAEILRAIGKCGNQSNLDFLKKAETYPSPRNILKRAAQWALKQME